jgi:hypothetical protein
VYKGTRVGVFCLVSKQTIWLEGRSDTNKWKAAPGQTTTLGELAYWFGSLCLWFSSGRWSVCKLWDCKGKTESKGWGPQPGGT